MLCSLNDKPSVFKKESFSFHLVLRESSVIVSSDKKIIDDFAVAVRVLQHGRRTGCRPPALCPPAGIRCWRCPSPTSRLDEGNLPDSTGPIEPDISPIRFNNVNRIEQKREQYDPQVRSALHRMAKTVPTTAHPL